jgi:hypothetical protein
VQTQTVDVAVEENSNGSSLEKYYHQHATTTDDLAYDGPIDGGNAQQHIIVEEGSAHMMVAAVT